MDDNKPVDSQNIQNDFSDVGGERSDNDDTSLSQ